MADQLSLTLSYGGNNAKILPFHGAKLIDEAIPDIFDAEAESWLANAVTVGVTITGSVQSGEYVLGANITEPLPIPGLPTEYTLGKWKLGFIGELIANAAGALQESASATLALVRPNAQAPEASPVAAGQEPA